MCLSSSVYLTMAINNISTDREECVHTNLSKIDGQYITFGFVKQRE
jgi:hypothetical protein